MACLKSGLSGFKGYFCFSVPKVSLQRPNSSMWQPSRLHQAKVVQGAMGKFFTQNKCFPRVGSITRNALPARPRIVKGLWIQSAVVMLPMVKFTAEGAMAKCLGPKAMVLEAARDFYNAVICKSKF